MRAYKPGRVLVVDDEPEVLELLVEALAGDGHDVTAVGDGLAALDRLAAGSFDVIVTDLVMPGLSGLDVAESAKRTRPGTGVILVTAWGDTARRARVGPCPIDFMLTKPIELDQLLLLVNTAVRAVTPGMRDGGAAGGSLVLVIDDDPVELKRVAMMLRGVGARVDTAPDGRRGLALACARPYDVILMDCRLLDDQGFATATALRRSRGVSAGAPVVALSDQALPDARARCLAAGIDDCVAKPLSAAAVADVVRKWTSGRPILDYGVLERLRELEDGSGLVEGMIERFLAQAGDMGRTLRRAAEAGDTGAITTGARSLARECTLMGAFAMADVCTRLEALGQADSFIGSLRLVDRLAWELERVRWVLQRRELPDDVTAAR